VNDVWKKRPAALGMRCQLKSVCTEVGLTDSKLEDHWPTKQIVTANFLLCCPRQRLRVGVARPAASVVDSCCFGYCGRRPGSGKLQRSRAAGWSCIAARTMSNRILIVEDPENLRGVCAHSEC